MPKIALLHPSRSYTYSQVQDSALHAPIAAFAIYKSEPGRWKHIHEIIYLLDMPNADLTDFDIVMIPGRMHAEMLLTLRDQFAAYLQQGGTALAFGEQPAPLLLGVV